MIRVGPAGWSYADWEGPVYPREKPKGFHPLAFLARYEADGPSGSAEGTAEAQMAHRFFEAVKRKSTMAFSWPRSRPGEWTSARLSTFTAASFSNAPRIRRFSWSQRISTKSSLCQTESRSSTKERSSASSTRRRLPGSKSA